MIDMMEACTDEPTSGARSFLPLLVERYPPTTTRLGKQRGGHLGLGADAEPVGESACPPSCVLVKRTWSLDQQVVWLPLLLFANADLLPQYLSCVGRDPRSDRTRMQILVQSKRCNLEYFQILVFGIS